MSDSLGDRMKNNYERHSQIYLIRRMPVIIRLDGKSFHSLTAQCKKPFDQKITNAMDLTAMQLCREIQGCKCAYTQSDEISLLLTDFDELATQAWFDYNVQKLVSVSAAMASGIFMAYYVTEDRATNPICFDSRTFNIPKEEVCNYFIWRQKDWIRNSLQMLSQTYFSPKQLHKKSQSDMHEMLHNVGVNWNNLSDRYKNGLFVFKSNEGQFKPSTNNIFTEDRNAIEQYLGEINVNQ